MTVDTTDRTTKLKKLISESGNTSICNTQNLPEWLKNILDTATQAAHWYEQTDANGALTETLEQIKTEETPQMITMIVIHIESLATLARKGCVKMSHESKRLVRLEIRQLLKKFLLHEEPQMRERTYAYIMANIPTTNITPQE